PRRLWKYATRRLGLKPYFRSPGDGRLRPQIPAHALLWALLIGHVLRQYAFHAVEALVRSPARRWLGVSAAFGDDALGYFTERLNPASTRAALAATLRRAKRNKAFDDSRFIGLAVDGTTVGRTSAAACPLCRPWRNAAGQVAGCRHHFTLISVVGTGLSLPFDVEPYGPGDSEYAAGQRLLRRAVGNLGVRFADYLVVDGEFATAPFLQAVGALGLHVVARLKANLPALLEAAQRRFRSQPPPQWNVIEAFWLTDFPTRRVSSRSLYRMAKSRWEIENQGFNDAKNRHGLQHICRHHANSLLVGWLLTLLALTIERLYRLRYLHRGTHRVRTAIELVRLLWLSLARPSFTDTS